jgi:hypothetical protein
MIRNQNPMFQYLKFLGNGKTLITLAIKLQKNFNMEHLSTKYGCLEVLE